jgi:glycosyltransferase involved in cell wall biosynthesis
MSGSGSVQSNPQVVDIWSHIAPQYGGVGSAAAGLALAVQQHSGWRSRLVALCSADEHELGDGIPPTVERMSLPDARPAADLMLRSALDRVIESCDAVHVHGLWLPHSIGARSAAAKLNKPVVSSVHGMLEAWELRNKRLKKSIYASLFERPSLARSHCFRALSEQEAADYRRFGLRNPVAVVPNGIGELQRINPEAFFRRYPETAGTSLVLFLGRVHYKKGILNLLRAWPSVWRRHSGAHLVVAGPDCDGTLKMAKEIVSRQALHRDVTFCGVLSGEVKLAALSAARVFCLPSYSEGQSVAVLEALSIGLPVVITPACNVDGVQENGAGLVTSNDPLSLAGALGDVLSLSSADWCTMSESARRLAGTRYNWTAIGSSMHAVYSWVLGGERPACVVN